MTVSTIRTVAPSVPSPSLGRVPGLAALLRKEIREWRRSRRARVVLLVSTAVPAFVASIAWIMELLRRNLPPEVTPPPPVSLLPLDNLLGAASTPLVALVAIFSAIALLVGERDSGTLAWTASKPVSRVAIWLAKWVAATAMLWLVAGVIPLIAVAALVTLLYGAPPLDALALLIFGTGAIVAFYTALSLGAATVVPSQAAVAGIGIGVYVLPDLLGAIVPIATFLPTSILGWSMATAAGMPTGPETVIGWAIGVALLVSFAAWRMNRLEL